MDAKKRKVEDDSSELVPPPLPTSATLYEEESLEEEDVSKLLEPLTKDQLIYLLRSAAARDPSTLDSIRAAADLDPSHRKLFVHGLGWGTTSDVLRAAFAPFGEIDDCRVVQDKSNGRSKGYGFVLFRHRADASAALRSPEILVEDRRATCQLASVGPFNPNPNNPNPKDNLPRKIYVGNVLPDVDGTRLREFFARYGEIEEGPIGFDRNTGKSKGFALFVYRSAESARKALEESNKNFEGHLLYCQRATDSKSKAIAMANANANAGPPPNAGANTGGFNGYGAPPPEMGFGQQLVQSYGQPMQPNAAAIAAILAAAGQNPATIGITSAVLASLNPAFGAASLAPPHPSIPPTASSHGYRYQNPVYQGPAGYQGHLGYQGAQPPSYQSGGGSY